MFEQELNSYWEKVLSTFTVTTPNPHINRMVNIWNAYQNMVTFNMSRSASYFESGVGRGMGFRDSAQDLLGFTHMIPEKARERILDLAATQLRTGGAYHQYQPLTKRGNDAVGSNFNDDPLWLVLSVAAYLKETGDWSILEEEVPFELTELEDLGDVRMHQADGDARLAHQHGRDLGRKVEAERVASVLNASIGPYARGDQSARIRADAGPAAWKAALQAGPCE